MKVSRSDFLADRKKSFRINPDKGMGRYRFYMCSDGLIKPQELPESWGLIYVSAADKARCVVNPYCKTLGGNMYTNGFENRNMLAEQGLHIKGHIESIYDKQYIYSHKD